MLEVIIQKYHIYTDFNIIQMIKVI